VNPFRSLRDYEVWVYTLPERFRAITYSALLYDSQPHPADSALASTDPHHKHVPPDIKHHRVPAPGLSFNRPNLPLLVQEIERDLLPPR